MSEPSLEPYLRARNVNPSLIPSNPPRGTRKPIPAKVQETEFTEFLQWLITLAISPIMIPLRFVSRTLRSPLTVSLILRLILLGFLVLSSAVFSVLAVGAFWYSWGTGGTVEVEGWLTYGSRERPIPHTLVPLPSDLIQDDLRYDVEVEMELVRPARGYEETGNFMLGIELRSFKDPQITVIGASQPSLPPPALVSSLIPLPSFPTYLLPPCVLPWPFRSFCPSRLLGYDGHTLSTLRNRRRKGGFSSPAKTKDVVLLKKELMEAVLLKPARGGDAVVGAVYVSIGREDAVGGLDEKCSGRNEVRTTGWVVIRFIPRPTGVRWLLSSHPLPPLLLLPPVSLTLTLTSSLFAFLIITYLARSRKTKTVENLNPMSEEALLAERTQQTFHENDLAEQREEARRRQEWEQVETSALGGLRKMPADKLRSRIGESTIGGSETTAPTAITTRSFGPIPESVTDESRSTTSETETVTEETGTDAGAGDTSEASISDDWEDQ